MPELLLVDSESQIASEVQLALESFQQEFPLQVVSNGSAALNLILSKQDSDPQRVPRILLVNQNIALDLTVDFVEKIGNIPGLPPIATYILTDERDPEILRQVYKYHVAGYILKPLDPQELQGMITTMLRYWQICEF